MIIFVCSTKTKWKSDLLDEYAKEYYKSLLLLPSLSISLFPLNGWNGSFYEVFLLFVIRTFSIGMFCVQSCAVRFSRLIEFLMWYKNFPFFIVHHFLCCLHGRLITRPYLHRSSRFMYLTKLNKNSINNSNKTNNCNNVKYFWQNACFAATSSFSRTFCVPVFHLVFSKSCDFLFSILLLLNESKTMLLHLKMRKKCVWV